MAKFYDQLSDDLKSFIADQKIFFVATAPQRGRINLSPKGMDTFRCLDNNTVAFLNLTGSGNETAAHVAENGRMTIMLCSFEDAPLILRLYGQARCIHQRDEAWSKLYSHFEPALGARQIVVLDIASVQTSCGFAVPLYEFKGERDTLTRWTEHRGEEGVRTYWDQHNLASIDGLPTKLLAD
jgi:hypothetical protein